MTDRLGESWSVILTNRDLGPTVSGSRRKRTCKVNASYGVGVLWLLRDVVDAGSVWWVFVDQVAVGGLHPFTTGNVGKTTLGGPVQSPSMTIRMQPVFPSIDGTTHLQRVGRACRREARRNSGSWCNQETARNLLTSAVLDLPADDQAVPPMVCTSEWQRYRTIVKSTQTNYHTWCLRNHQRPTILRGTKRWFPITRKTYSFPSYRDQEPLRVCL